MGYDCTLHVVDERLLRDVFVPKLLGKSKEKTPRFSEAFPDASKLWTQVRNALAGDNPSETAQLVCQLAILFASAHHPHVAERGFAISLWPNLEATLARTIPDELTASPGVMFDAIVEAHPALRGRFPTWFEGNYSTGVFIPASKVPAAIAWVEETTASLTKGDRRLFVGLLKVLRTAARFGLAYWEATDLGVAQADAQLLDLGGPEGASGLAIFEPGFYEFQSDLIFEGDEVVFEDRAIKGAVRLDLSTWPPARETREQERVLRAARSRGGKWLFLSAPAKGDWRSELAYRLLPSFTAPLAEGRVIAVPEALIDGMPAMIGFVDEDPVIVPADRQFDSGVFRRPLMIGSDGALREVEDLPAVVGERRQLPDDKVLDLDVVSGAVRLGDGADVLIWDAQGYERVDGRFQKTFQLDALNSFSQVFTTAPAGQDGFYYLSDRKLFEARRGQPPKPHLPSIENIMEVAPGPGGALLLRQGHNPEGDVGKLYLPDEGAYISIEPEVFGQPKADGFHWLRGSKDRVIARWYSQILSVPVKQLLGQKRVKP